MESLFLLMDLRPAVLQSPIYFTKLVFQAAHGNNHFNDFLNNFQLAKNKCVQSKLRAEILDNLGPNDAWNFENIANLTYLGQVFDG